jgi:hypothetical protein
VIEIVDDCVAIGCHCLGAHDRYSDGDGNADNDDADDDEQNLLLAHTLPPSISPMRLVFRITHGVSLRHQEGGKKRAFKIERRNRQNSRENKPADCLPARSLEDLTIAGKYYSLANSTFISRQQGNSP